MFLREKEGVYEFGSKRITMKIECDTIQVRVGGGYLTIDEFLDTYTSPELERIERRVAQHKLGTCHIGSEKLPRKASPSKDLQSNFSASVCSVRKASGQRSGLLNVPGSTSPRKTPRHALNSLSNCPGSASPRKTPRQGISFCSGAISPRKTPRGTKRQP